MNGRKYSLRAVIAAATATGAIVVSVFAASPAMASSTERSAGPAVVAAAKSSTLSPKDTAELNAPLAAANQNTRVFDPAIAASTGASNSAVADFAAVVRAAGWTIASNSKALTKASTGAEIAAAAARRCAGCSGYRGFYSVFWQIALDSCQTDVLITAIRGGGGAVAAVGALLAAVGFPQGAIVAAVGVLIVAAPWPLDMCKSASANKAIYVNIFVAGGLGCWGQ